MSYIELRDVHKIYRVGEMEIHALDGVSLNIEKGEVVIIAGASGAGKSTLLNLLGGMDTVTRGDLIVDGKHVSQFNENELTDYRRFDIGFVFQFYNLVQNLTSIENVELATEICENPLDSLEVLKRVGLEDRIENFPSQLSGGEQQRVAIARALAKNPKLLLCDEPTGALDYVTGKQILKLLQETSKLYHMTVLIITHNLALCPMGDRVFRMKSGKIVEETYNEAPMDIDLIEW
ncbi:MAG: ABC transporter ATP-binding protein [Solobacterium sp.]|nr:ABC transporter ATP-binding protein [Solobacterium sp.]